jgi:hypothetical protein
MALRRAWHVGRYRVTVPEAAKRLGVKEGAIRKRIERDTIDHEKSAEDGRVYVYIDLPPVEDTGYDESYPPGYEALIRSQQEQIDFLRGELQRKDHLLAAALERIPALEAPPDTPQERQESPVGASEEEGTGGAPPEKRSWWRRVFGT